MRRHRETAPLQRTQRRVLPGFVARADDVFGRIAGRYDVLCDVFSLGIHRLWKRRVARVIAEAPWSVLLDGASGTGDITFKNLASGQILPVRAQYVRAAGTTAADIVALG